MPNAPDEGQIAVGQFLSWFGFFRLVSFMPVDEVLPQQQQQELCAYYASPQCFDQARTMQDELTALSPNGRQTFVGGADHLSLVHNEEHAQHTAQAILEMVESVRTD